MTLDRATFEALRDDLLKKRVDIDALIAALDVVLADDVLMSPQIVVPAVPVAKTPAPARLKAAPPKRIAPPAAHPATPVDDAKVKAKALFMEYKKAAEIAETVGRPLAHVYQWASDGKWRDEREQRYPQPTNGTKHLRTAEELRAERRARDDRIIEEVRERNEEEQHLGRDRAKASSNFVRNGAGSFE